ncbi:hypothetical protein Fmac_018497 [Flemingia macrophylla]|uniref:Uncharacterized protein n=1 Tax=Flemingia macrophylla TaxID=520843 RepID=A0ABD1M588_9FABA
MGRVGRLVIATEALMRWDYNPQYSTHMKPLKKIKSKDKVHTKFYTGLPQHEATSNCSSSHSRPSSPQHSTESEDNDGEKDSDYIG